MTMQNVAQRSVAEDLSAILDSPDVSRLVDELQQTRWTGRPGYPLGAMIGIALAKSLYALPTWTRTVALVREHPALAAVIAGDGDVPSVYACYRFTAKRRERMHLLEGCIARVVKEMKKRNPVLGWDVAIDASNMPPTRTASVSSPRAARNARRTRTWTPPGAIARPSPRARAAASTATGCTWLSAPRPIFRSRGEWRRATRANVRPSVRCSTGCTRSESTPRPPRWKGYDANTVHDACAKRGVLPVIALRETPAVKRGEHKPPSCEHGTWTFRGGGLQAQGDQMALPHGQVQARVTLGQGRSAAPADPARDRALTQALRQPRSGRARVRQAQARMALLPLRVRGLEWVRLHADLTILAKLCCALTRARTVALAA